MPGPFARAAIAALVSAALIAGYAFSYTFAQSTPDPHALPVAVGDPALAARIAAEHGGEYDVHRVTDRAQAVRAIERRDVYAALMPGPRLLLAPAAGRQTTQLVSERLPAAAGLAQPPQTELVRPLATRDPNGSALDFTVFPTIIFGIVLPLLLTNVAPVIPLGVRLAYLGGYAVVGGLAAVLVVQTGLDALPGPFVSLAAIAALALLAVAAVTSALIGLLGPPGVIVAIVVVLITGNAASGTQLAHELMPGFYRDVGPWLPPGCLAQALRNVAYFDHHDVLRPLLVLGGYALAGLTAGALLRERRPAPQGAPSGPTPDLERTRA